MGDHNRFRHQSKEDQTHSISKSVFVTNFPDHICARDLWKVCNNYGSVVDVYIPFKKSKSEAALLHLFRLALLRLSNPGLQTHVIVLDDSCLKERDFSMSLMGKVKEVSSIPNLYIILSKEGFQSVKITYLGDLWVLIKLDFQD
ncbi:RNA-directed DNA polymerase, eukaryota, reverse transcriptase zinc-binding domain protein [Tanacetum coccineum]